MNDDVAAAPERDPRFPGGAWTGYFLQHWLPGRQTTRLDFAFRDGRLTGEGADRVGPYAVDGTYDLATGRCEWTKKYLRKHSVAYRGVNDGHGIWGVWEIRQLGGLYTDRGGFHLWPVGMDVSAEAARTEKAVLAAMRQEFGSPALAVARLLLFPAAVAGGVLVYRLLQGW